MESDTENGWKQQTFDPNGEHCLAVENGFENAKAFKKGKENGEHHPLTLYIELGEFVVCCGRETLFQTENDSALAAFLAGWRKVYLSTD